jgi:hypothetical protein
MRRAEPFVAMIAIPLSLAMALAWVYGLYYAVTHHSFFWFAVDFFFFPVGVIPGVAAFLGGW